MKNKIMTMLIIELLLVCACSGIRDGEPTDKDLQEKYDVLQHLESVMKDTPYCALIQHTSVDIIPVPDPFPNDGDVEEKHIYHAKVLETYRGQKLKNISYTLVCEKGEETTIIKQPFIITLCADKEGFFWPGTGSDFEATQENLKTARRISKKLKSVKQSFPYCEFN